MVRHLLVVLTASCFICFSAGCGGDEEGGSEEGTLQTEETADGADHLLGRGALWRQPEQTPDGMAVGRDPPERDLEKRLPFAENPLDDVEGYPLRSMVPR